MTVKEGNAKRLEPTGGSLMIKDSPPGRPAAWTVRCDQTMFHVKHCLFFMPPYVKCGFCFTADT